MGAPMALPPELPIVDHHCHLSPTGDGLAAVERFRAAGGTHLFLATQSYGAGPPATLDGYREQFETTLSLARRAEAEQGVTVYVVVAPFPVDLLPLSERLGLAPAVALLEAALELSGRWVVEQRAVALGEIGRPHFEVPEPLVEPSDRLFRKALEVARDAGCPAVVHSEDLDASGYRGIAELARSVGFPIARLVKHYARAIASGDSGIVPSYLAQRSLASESLRSPAPFFWETDYLDDPARPGAVLDLATVPRRARQAVDADPSAAERLRVPFESSVRSVYGFTPVVARGDG